MHEVKHDGYRLQIHVGKGRVRLYTINGADWTDRYPRIVEEAARIKVAAVIDAEVVCTDAEGQADFDRLHSRCFEHEAVACAFDLLKLNGIDLRRLPLMLRKEKRYASCWRGRETVFSSSSTSKWTGRRHLRRRVIWAWKALSQSG